MIRIIKTPRSVIREDVNNGDWPSSAEEVNCIANLPTLLNMTSRQANAIVKPHAAIIANFSWRLNSFLNDLCVLKYLIAFRDRCGFYSFLEKIGVQMHLMMYGIIVIRI